MIGCMYLLFAVSLLLIVSILTGFLRVFGDGDYIEAAPIVVIICTDGVALRCGRVIIILHPYLKFMIVKE